MFFIKRIQYNSPVILTFALLSLLVLGISTLTEGLSTRYLFSIYRAELTEPLFYFRLFGHVFGHSNFAHYFNNFILILLIGPMLEEKYGWKNMLIMMVTTALLTGILNIIFFDTMLLGASGIVFMLILLSSFVNLERGRIPVTLLLIICVFIGREIYDGFVNTDNISQLSHIIGGLCGAVLGFFINKNKLIGSNVDV